MENQKKVELVNKSSQTQKKEFKIVDSNIEIYFEGKSILLITEVPSDKLNEFREIEEIFNRFRTILIGFDKIKYENLLILNDIFEYPAKLNKIENTICLFLKNEKIAVIVDNDDLYTDFSDLEILIMSAFYFIYNNFRPYEVDGMEIMDAIRNLYY